MNRVSSSLKPLEEPPGIRQISPGKNKDGFWTYKIMSEQVADLMDIMGFLHLDLQLVFLFNWISGHAKNQDGGLAVLQTNAKYGVKKGKGMRYTKRVEGCLGEVKAKLWKVLGGDGGVIIWFASSVAAVDHGIGTVVEVYYKLKLGDTHHMELSIDVDCPLPFYALNVARNDCSNLNKNCKEVTNKKD